MSKEADLAFIGRTIAGKFAIESLLGGGAMGSVYRARHSALEKTVAIKVMHRELTRDKMFSERFLREAKAASRIDHPNSMRVLDYGEEPDGTLYMAMEFLDGRDLFKVIQEDWPLSPARIATLLMQVCAALAVAHDMGVVHRDLKPENIMVLAGTDDEGNKGDVVKVCDFGIAKIIDKRTDLTKSEGPRLTTAGLVVGTPEYMSPEQGRGESLDARADIYSLGVILFQMLTGRVPFDAESALGIVLKHVTDEPPKPTSINSFADKRLEAICLKAMSKRREDRFQSARELRTELRRIVDASIAGDVGPSTVRLPDEPHASTDASNAATAVAIDSEAIRRAAFGPSMKTLPMDFTPAPPQQPQPPSTLVSSSPNIPDPTPPFRLERTASKITPLGTNVDEPLDIPRTRMTGLVVAAVLLLATIGSLAWYVRGRTPHDGGTASASTASATPPTTATTPSTKATETSAPTTTVAPLEHGKTPAHASSGKHPAASASGPGPLPNFPIPGEENDAGAAPAPTATTTTTAAGPWTSASVRVAVGNIHNVQNTTPAAVRRETSQLQFTLCYQKALSGVSAKPAPSKFVMHLGTDDQMRITETRWSGGPPIPETAAQCVMNFMIGKSLKAPAITATGPAVADVDLVFLPE